MKSSPTITYLNHESATINLTKHPNLRTSFTVFGSPYSPRVGMWAFSYDKAAGDEEGKQLHSNEEGQAQTTSPPDPDHQTSKPLTGSHLWSAIPLDTDIVITHTPPYTHCDESVSKRRALGCEHLRRALWRVRPKLAVCGHVHEGRGVERVRWDILGASGAPYSELGTTDQWQDPGGAGPGKNNNKMSLVDLTSRAGGQKAQRPLDHDGSPLRKTWPGDQRAQDGVCQHSFATTDDATALPGFSTRGVGGNPNASVRCDLWALCCRMGRRETCVVNCAIAATNWPHTGGKRFNKPIVVDLDLPILEQDDDKGERSP